MQSTKNGPWLDASHCDTQGAQQESPLPAIGAFEQCCSNSRKTAANAAGAPPRTQRHGRDIPGGWSRSGAPHSRARANVVMSDDRECRGNEPAERTDWLYADGGARPRAGAAGQPRVGRDRRWGCFDGVGLARHHRRQTAEEPRDRLPRQRPLQRERRAAERNQGRSRSGRSGPGLFMQGKGHWPKSRGAPLPFPERRIARAKRARCR